MWKDTAIIFVGYQKDYFSSDGILRGVIEESDRTYNILDNSLQLLERAASTEATLIQTPIIFTEDYSELEEPVGILKTILEVKAFRTGSSGSEIIDEFQEYGERIMTIAGKRGLDAFSNTKLHGTLQENNIRRVVLVGAVTSICIDSTGRSAHEKGYKVSILSDCTASRTIFEQNFYCENIFPLYANVLSSKEFLGQLPA
jgi:nicotinamidase-related amidase